MPRFLKGIHCLVVSSILYTPEIIHKTHVRLVTDRTVLYRTSE